MQRTSVDGFNYHRRLNTEFRDEQISRSLAEKSGEEKI